MEASDNDDVNRGGCLLFGFGRGGKGRGVRLAAVEGVQLA